MTRTLLLGREEPLPITTGAATSFAQASAVRLVNVDPAGAAHTVTVVETQSGNVIGSMTMPGGSVETLEKQYSHCIYSSNALVFGAKVGFTG